MKIDASGNFQSDQKSESSVKRITINKEFTNQRRIVGIENTSKNSVPNDNLYQIGYKWAILVKAGFC